MPFIAPRYMNVAEGFSGAQNPVDFRPEGVAVAGVQNKPGQQCGVAAAAGSAPKQKARGRRCRPRADGEEIDVAEPARRSREEFRQIGSAADRDQEPARFQACGGGPEPELQSVASEHMGRRPAGGARRAHGLADMKRRIHQYGIRAGMGQAGRQPIRFRRADIDLRHADARRESAIGRQHQGGAGTGGEFRITLHQEGCAAGAASRGAKPGDAGAGTEIDHKA